jgi:hypothetical protein
VVHNNADDLNPGALLVLPRRPGPWWRAHTASTPATTVDMKLALIQDAIPGQSLDQLCAARDSNPEPAD